MKRQALKIMGKNILFSLIICFVFSVILEIMLHLLILVGLLPHLYNITPKCYFPPYASYNLDGHGSPIFINGFKYVSAKGVPMKPIFYDSRGFRPGDPQRLNTTDYKIGFFGDSYTEGLYVSGSETFPMLVEQELRKKGNPIGCFNFAVGGTGTYHQYLRFLTISEWTKLDHVVVCLLPQNDILNNHISLGKPFELPNSPYITIGKGGVMLDKRPENPEKRIESINR